MNEKDFFDEKQETKRASFSCPHCRERADYDVRWLTRRKKSSLPRGANEQDRARFTKSRDYMVRIDDMLACKMCAAAGASRFPIRSRSSSSKRTGLSENKAKTAIDTVAIGFLKERLPAPIAGQVE